ncbi:MAG: vWA domain-containing protein [Methanoregula sp.]|uniref:vWA domain-containing protein n=1 Tax=Methanoregula sp. TaxID=2052170 RepID=UPI003BAFAAEC
MRGKKIATLNQAIREALPEIQKAVEAYPQVDIRMRAIKFSNNAAWHVGPDPVPLNDFVWPELETSGLTATAKAIKLLTEELSIDRMPRRGLPPVCILISDGFCTDPQEEYDAAIAELGKIPWGIKAVRLAIAIGDESDYNAPELIKFTNQESVGLIRAHSPEELVAYIKWASVSASVASSRGRSRSIGSGEDISNVALDSPPQMITSNTDLF